jgi:hypothetical protein
MAFTLAQLEHLFCWTGGDGGDDADMLSIGGLWYVSKPAVGKKARVLSADYEKAQTSPTCHSFVC